MTAADRWLGHARGTAGEDDAARSMRRRSPPGLKGEARPGRPLASLAASEGLPAIRLHDMRHSYATAGLAAGVPPKVMSERLGHATVAFTLDTYTSALPAMDKSAADVVAALILGTEEAGGSSSAL
jgi:integrase